MAKDESTFRQLKDFMVDIGWRYLLATLIMFGVMEGSLALGLQWWGAVPLGGASTYLFLELLNRAIPENKESSYRLLELFVEMLDRIDPQKKER